MLAEIVTEKNVEIGIAADDWEAAIRCAGNILVQNGCVEERYVDRIIEITKEIGPYMVIDKGVVLAHARPEDGVKNAGMSFVVLKEGVAFGAEEYDPVKLVIGLSAKDSSSHIDVLQDIALLLEQENFKQQVFEVNTKEAFIELLKGK